MFPVPKRRILSTHWGTYVAVSEGSELVGLGPFEGDPAPSPIARSIIDAMHSPARILRPMVRSSFLEKRHKAGGELRGREPFVAVSWPVAIALVGKELDRVRLAHGNSAIFGGSYGWASAGRFHHAQSQIHRFLNIIGGYTRSVNSYSYGAAEVILPHVIGDHRGLFTELTTWQTIAKHSELVVAFGGLSSKNAQINAGGLRRHGLTENVERLRQSGIDILSVSPIRDDTDPASNVAWLPIKPTTDVALMLAIAHVLIAEDRHDVTFLERYTAGFPAFRAYVMGENNQMAKTPEWASPICAVPPATIRDLARRMSSRRTLLTMSWSLQRAEHGEQPYWMLITLAAMLGQIGLPGGGFGFGYGSVDGVGNAAQSFKWPSLPQGHNPVETFIPVARLADMLLSPGGACDYNGQTLTYPDIRLIYWAGGNPFHHHQDLNRLLRAWKRPETVIAHEMFWNGLARHSDIVLPVTLQVERNDITCSPRDRALIASHKLVEPPGEARDDHWIFASLARELSLESLFTEDRDEEGWLRHLYDLIVRENIRSDMMLPDFDEFWMKGMVLFPEETSSPPLLQAFRSDPAAHPLSTPSGLIEIYSERVASFGYKNCPGHPVWMQPNEWLGASTTKRTLHLLSNQPKTKLHSQLDHGINSRESKIQKREPIRMHPLDAASRGISDGAVVRVFNERGACLAGARLSTEVMPGVVQLSTGAWYDPLMPGSPGSLDKHGNPNLLTQDRGTSSLAQGCSANSCLVEVELFVDDLPRITCYDAPDITQ